jgi:hypothetical protein
VPETKGAWIGGNENDDLSKVHVTGPRGQQIPAVVSLDDSADGKRIVEAWIVNPGATATLPRKRSESMATARL